MLAGVTHNEIVGALHQWGSGANCNHRFMGAGIGVWSCVCVVLFYLVVCSGKRNASDRKQESLYTSRIKRNASNRKLAMLYTCIGIFSYAVLRSASGPTVKQPLH
jgi:hypothetical protein